MKISHQVIILSFILAVISLFLPWMELFSSEFFYRSGLDEQAYFYLLIFAYPLYCVIKKKAIHLLYLPIIIFHMFALSEFMDTRKYRIGDDDTLITYVYNLFGTGLILYGISLILLVVGMGLQAKKDVMKDPLLALNKMTK
ncbi:hypothetical protein CIB95_11190 [Lottiidibacillus patelloidae]|uniref:Uncharacterized protein n=1 Tax=Lottiidibacillus patelloidae TaxID=2670334 RepID=A0A263BSV0_9BACI|nr:hypothetical protein [Lottiidibacillus patelloidae]OZM56775.1 hypothetical protein CIB95_11190 [Lottiidibacillus patelloidae]